LPEPIFFAVVVLDPIVLDDEELPELPHAARAIVPPSAVPAMRKLRRLSPSPRMSRS
jgi:hypothetical protein